MSLSMYHEVKRFKITLFFSIACRTLSSVVFFSRYIAIYPYTPRKEDELELRKGEMFLVFERCQDGWFKGTSMHTSKIGVFPGNYVAPITRYSFQLTHDL